MPGTALPQAGLVAPLQQTVSGKLALRHVTPFQAQRPPWQSQALPSDALHQQRGQDGIQ